jgi:hypothetical protein
MNAGAARPWIIMALIFVLGGVTGSLLTIAFRPHFSHGPAPQEIRNHWMAHLAWRLHLSPDQVAKIGPIVTDAETKIQEAHRKDLAQISGIMQAANASMKPYLNADQQAQLAEMETEREQMFDGRMHGMGHPHGPFGEHEAGDHPRGSPPPDLPPQPGA